MRGLVLSGLGALACTGAPTHAPGSAPALAAPPNQAVAGGGGQLTAAGMAGRSVRLELPTPTTAEGVACSKGDGKACLRLGEQAAQQQAPERQYQYYVAACSAHVGLACVHLGQSVEPNPNKRVAWLQRSLVAFESACKAGDAESCYYFGIALERGVGIPANASRAQQMYATGCQLGNLYACTNEAGLHLQGKGVKQDFARAAVLYANACERRDDRACYWLGSIHDQELDLRSNGSHVQVPVRSGKLGVELRVKEAKRLARSSPAKHGPAIEHLLALDPKPLIAACNQGQPLACYELGVATQVGGARFPKDDKKAVGYYEKACSLGSGWGCLRAGDCYEHAYGVPSDFSKASKYFLDVCERGVGGTEGFERDCANLAERIDAM